MNSLFLKDLAAKTRRGLEVRVRQGKSGGGISYGYDVVTEHGARGEPLRGGREINVDEAEVVKRTFREYTDRLSPQKIAKRLNQEHVAGPGGRPWGNTTIRGHAEHVAGLLHNELYIGLLVWNRLRYLKDPRTGKRISRINPPGAWVITEVPQLRIIDDDFWNKVQERLQDKRESPTVVKARGTQFWLTRRPRHLLTGLTHCGVCGGPLASIGSDYLGCATARQQGNCTNTRSIRRGPLENVILDSLRDRLMEPDLVAEFTRAFTMEINNLNRDRERTTSRYERELVEVDRSLNELIDALARGFKGDTLCQRYPSGEGRLPK
jgi:hypothetical protein